MSFEHVSVLLLESVEALNIKPDGIYVDCTAGGGGHSFQIASKLSDAGRIISIDRDSDAIAAAGERLRPFGKRSIIVRRYYGSRIDAESLRLQSGPSPSYNRHIFH